jgi:hypothetical protein
MSLAKEVRTLLVYEAVNNYYMRPYEQSFAA